MDVLGSILKTMEKPPSRSRNVQKIEEAEEETIPPKLTEEEITFTARITQRLVSHFALPKNTELKFEPMDYPQRNIIHKVAHSLEHVSYDFGVGNKKRYVMVYRQTHQPDYDDRYIRRYRQPYSELQKRWSAGKLKPVPKATPVQNVPPIPMVKPFKEALARLNAETSSGRSSVLKVERTPKIKPAKKKRKPRRAPRKAPRKNRKRRPRKIPPPDVDTFVPKHDYREKYLHLFELNRAPQGNTPTNQIFGLTAKKSGVRTVKEVVKDLLAQKEKSMNQKGPTRQG